MSLRRRIALASAAAVAAVAVTLGVVGYLSARSNLIGNVTRQLHSRAQQFLAPHPHHGGPDDHGGAARRPFARAAPSAPPLGGAPGYFQSVASSGRVEAGDGGTPELPVDGRVLAIAHGAPGSYVRTTRVKGIHVEVLTVYDAHDRKAVEVALPLSSVDDVLHQLALTYALLVAAGIIAAGLIGLLIARSALAPITRFSEQTERVTSALDSPRRLEESGASELRRLAASFNETLDALERSVIAQRHLIADASHELRTPLAALRSNIQVFLEAERLPLEDRVELQHAVLSELDELTRLVTDVLELARGAAPSDHVEPVELDNVVREAIARAGRRAPGLRFEIDLEPTVIVNAPDRVARAVGNVVDNAHKYGPSDGDVEITLRDGTLRVRDHGPGFAERDLGHVFDRFYRADAARRMPGSGLGLAIVKQAAEAFGGSVRASNAPDGGAVLEVRFGSVSARASSSMQTA